MFKLSGIAAAAFDAFNSAGEMPSDVDKLIAIGGLLCAFKPFDMAVRPFGKIFGESIGIGSRDSKLLYCAFRMGAYVKGRIDWYYLPVMAECMVADADIGLEECARFGDGDDDDAFRIVLVVVITGEIDDADCDCKIYYTQKNHSRLHFIGKIRIETEFQSYSQEHQLRMVMMQ